ncbi:MAG: hypothetical protein AAFY60_13250, partial [Myxococcota bacterium]
MHNLQHLASSRGLQSNQELSDFLASDEGASFASFDVNGELIARDDVLTRLGSDPTASVADTFEFGSSVPASLPNELTPHALSPGSGAWANLGLPGLASVRVNNPQGLGPLRTRVADPAVADQAAVEPEPEPEPERLAPPEHGFYPTVSADRYDSERMAALQRLVNDAGYAEATGQSALVDDGDGGDLTGAGITWLAEVAGAPMADPDAREFWQSVHAHVQAMDGEHGERARAAFESALGNARTQEAPRGGYPTVRGETLNSDRMATLQRVINAAGYAELTGEPALDVDSDGGPLTRAGTEWLAEHVGSTTDDPNSPEFWNAVHTFAARDTGPQGDALRTAFGAAVGETVLSETRLEEGPLARSRVGDDDGVDGAPDGADAVPDAPVSGPGLAEEVRPIPDSPLELPTVAADVRDDPRMERLQTIVNEAGYADATGRVALDIDGTGGTLTRAGTEWLAQRVGSPTADPNDSRFWEALNAYTRSPDSGASESFRAAV